MRASAPRTAAAVKEAFRRFARSAADSMGSAWAFLAAVAIVVGWALSGPLFRFSEGWQLVVNTLTSIVTFVMVFLIQSTQNRDAKATQLKLDELLRALEGARSSLINLEALSDDEFARLEAEFERMRRVARTRERKATPAEDAGGDRRVER